MNSLDELKDIERIHQQVDLSDHIQIMFGQRTVGPLAFLKLADHCSEKTNTPAPNWKRLRRLERLYNLLTFFEHAVKNTSGSFIECGVFRGYSGLALAILNNAITDESEAFSRPIWLLDSFEGLSQPSAQDTITSERDGHSEPLLPMKAGHFSTSLDIVKGAFHDIENVRFAKGWIPEAFTQLDDDTWGFVHIDVDLYSPTKASLEYFYPRLQSGGIIINDDFGSPLFPGARKAWDEFFSTRSIGYAVLDSGQAVYVKK